MKNKKLPWIATYWDNEDGRIDGKRKEMVSISFSVGVFDKKWTTMFSARTDKVEKNIYITTNGTLSEINLQYFDMAWKFYEGREMPYRDMRHGCTRPTFESRPDKLIEVMTSYKDHPFVQRCMHGPEKFHVAADTWFAVESGRVEEYKYPIEEDKYPGQSEISSMQLRFDTLEDAQEWLKEVEVLMQMTSKQIEAYHVAVKYHNQASTLQLALAIENATGEEVKVVKETNKQDYINKMIEISRKEIPTMSDEECETFYLK